MSKKIDNETLIALGWGFIAYCEIEEPETPENCLFIAGQICAEYNGWA